MKNKNFCLILLTLSVVLVSCATSTDKSVDITKEAYDGYTLFNPQASKMTYLIDNNGEIIKEWESEYKTGSSVYLLESGLLLRSATLPAEFGSAGGAGRIEIINSNNEVVWFYEYNDEKVRFHHDMEYLPNGNIVLVAWERISAEDVLAAGRDPKMLPSDDDGNLWVDHLVEVNNDGEIVWEWHIMDHLVQDFDPGLENYGVVSDHPELVDINFLGLDKAANDWNHVNAVDYNPELDQLIISVRNFGEVWIIDHNTTTEEASGVAGDLLYRWGNPEAYKMGDADDQVLFGQHDAKWIEADLPGAGNILVFNNGDDERPYSSVDEITPPLNSDGSYEFEGSAFAPKVITWSYKSENSDEFYSDHISGAQRLPNGNTLICAGADGRFFEVTDFGEIVWDYINPNKVIAPKTKKETNTVFRAEKYAQDYKGVKKVNGTSNQVPAMDPYKVTINGFEFSVTQPMYSWDELPETIKIEKGEVVEFTDNSGATHWYQTVYIPSMNLNWYQNAYLAQDAGGYLSSINSEEENAFVFSLVKEEKFWWAFPEDGGHFGIKIGPNLGGFQPVGSVEPAGGWRWISGEEMTYKNWAVNLDDGVIDKDPRDNSQPNDSAYGQPIMGFGELNVPVPTWGDYTGEKTNPKGDVRGAYGFIIEFENKPM